MASKPAPERTFTEPFQVRVTPAQLDSFRKAAEADGRSVSNWARDRLERAAAKELKAKG
jgi:predicted HicB family RNase H-like nuclease